MSYTSSYRGKYHIRKPSKSETMCDRRPGHRSEVFHPKVAAEMLRKGLGTDRFCKRCVNSPLAVRYLSN